MTKQPVTFVFSSTDSVDALATLIEQMIPIWDAAAQEYGKYSYKEVDAISVTANEWVTLLRDFIRENNSDGTPVKFIHKDQ